MNDTFKRILLWGGITIGIVALLFFLARIGTRSSNGGIGVDGAPTELSLSSPVNEKDHIKGNQNAKVTIVEYSDFQCPACREYYPIVKQLSEAFSPEEVGFVYRHFPLRTIHLQSDLAARAAEAAATQGKFWDMHDMLFNTQTDWSGRNDAEDFFVRLAESLGLNKEQFETDMKAKQTQEKIDAAYDDALAIGLNSTPTFFLNGKSIQAPNSYAAFKALIEQTLVPTP